jgi:hypothetical protein
MVVSGTSKDNGAIAVKFSMSKNLTGKSTMFPHCNTHKYTWTSPDGKTHNKIHHVLLEKGQYSSTNDVQPSDKLNVIMTITLVVKNFRERLSEINKQHKV